MKKWNNNEGYYGRKNPNEASSDAVGATLGATGAILPKKSKKLSSPEEIYNRKIAEILRTERDKDYSKAFDLCDQLIKDINENRRMYAECDEAYVWYIIKATLTRQYKDAIIRKYDELYNEILNFGFEETYKASGYPGTREQYARAQAITELNDMYRQTRYGGYMHSIIMDVLRNHFEEERAKSQQTKKGFSNPNR